MSPEDMREFSRGPPLWGETDTPSPPTKGAPFMKRLAAVLTLAGAMFAVVAPTTAFAAGPQLCVTAHVDINGTTQDINQCAQ